ncbi:hypothetical protein D3C80_1898340 [compost metagenome]
MAVGKSPAIFACAPITLQSVPIGLSRSGVFRVVDMGKLPIFSSQHSTPRTTVVHDLSASLGDLGKKTTRLLY